MLKKILIMLTVVFLIAGGAISVRALASAAAASPDQTPGQFEEVTPTAAAALIQQQQANPDFAILDVRTPEEFAEGHLEHAINIDYKAPTFQALLTILNQQKTYLLYCHSGKRSGEAFQLMKDLHFSHAYNMTGGIEEWTAKQLPIVK